MSILLEGLCPQMWMCLVRLSLNQMWRLDLCRLCVLIVSNGVL